MKQWFLLLSFFILLVGACSNGDDNDDCNDARNPADDIGWIREMINQNQNLATDAHIICYELDRKLVFLVDLCIPCSDGFAVYDCEKVEVCYNDQNGTDTCDYFINNAVNEVLVWKNY